MTARRTTAVLLAAVLALTFTAGCSDDEPAAGEARLEVTGTARVERAGGERDTVTGTTDVGPGDRVEIVEGTAVMALRGGARLELRQGDGGETGPTVVRMDEVPELEAGDLLVSAPDALSVSAAGTSVRVAEGTAKVSRALGMAVDVYDAAVELDSAGQERPVPALRAVLVPALGRPQPLRPVTYDATDAWDRRFLGEAIELGRRLEQIAQTYTSSLRPGEGRTPGFFRLVLPGLDDEQDFGADLIDLARPPGETLIGAAITDLGRRGAFAERWASVFSFRDQGAEWGLVALDQAVSRTPLLGAVTEAVGASPLAFAAPAPTGADPTPPTSEPPGSPEPVSPPTTAAPSSGSPPTTVASPPPPVTIPENQLTPILDPVLDPVVDLVGGLIDGLTGLLGPPPPG